MGNVADAGQAWEDAVTASDAADSSGTPKEKLAAKAKLQDAFDAFQRALKDNAAANDDADDAAYRRKAFGADVDMLVDVKTESGGSTGVGPSSGSAKGSI